MHAATSSDMSPRQRIDACLQHLEHVLPSQASLKDFVHHNTLHGFQHLPFAEALTAAQRLGGARVWLPEAYYRDCHATGRIDDSDLAAAISLVCGQAAIDLDAALATVGDRSITRREVLRLSLQHDLAPLSLAQFCWRVEEGGVLADHAALWSACLAALGIDASFSHPEELLELSAREEMPLGSATADRTSFGTRAAELWDVLRQKVGAAGTVSELVRDLTDEDAFETVRPLLIRHLAAFLDLGVAPWAPPARAQGFYAAWRASAAGDIAWTLDSFVGARQAIAALPATASDTICDELIRLGLPEERWQGYLERLALELPGWSGMFLWRHARPGYGGSNSDASPATEVDMRDYLAVRLVLERLAVGDIVRRHWDLREVSGEVGVTASLAALGDYFRQHPAELWVRHAYHSGDLPEFLLDLVEPHLPAVGDTALPQPPGLWDWLADRIEAWREPTQGPSAEQAVRHSLARSAWPLFQLLRQLELTADAVNGLGRMGAEALLGGLRLLDAQQRGFLWLNAYERHYRQQVLTALTANHGRWPGHVPLSGSGPQAQLVFCMDDREEGIRRHLEEIAPQLETLGGAAHFAVFQNYYGLDDEQPTPLCPVIPEVIVPAHNVREVVRTEKVGAGETATAGLAANMETAIADLAANTETATATAAAAVRHRQRYQLRRAVREQLHQLTRHAPLRGTLLSVLAAPLALAGLFWRSLAPAGFGATNAAWRERFDPRLPTRLDLNAPDNAAPATPQTPRDGFTDAEQAERIGNFLIALGLTKDFAPLLVIMGHGSSSSNNPHLAAYDCGACSGRHSGPNARLFAAMANRPEVRARLAARGIDIPATTWLLAGEHDTATDRFVWYDRTDLPAQLDTTFSQVATALERAGKAHAQERCRRLFSAPPGIGQDAALHHVAGRRHDFAQPRPELGHVANACALFGRRAMSRGTFLDRRAFLISYDPLQDPDGQVLERHLLINGAVGAGISLEYFFSTVNNEHFGCGSKTMHNVAGYVGVMQGANSDLRTGLPKQMIEIHEAMRLLVVIEQTLAIITAVYQRQPPLQELVGNGWVMVAAKDPVSGAIHLFDPALGWQPWPGDEASLPSLPTLRQSVDWFAGRREALPPVLLESPVLLEKPVLLQEAVRPEAAMSQETTMLRDAAASLEKTVGCVA